MSINNQLLSSLDKHLKNSFITDDREFEFVRSGFCQIDYHLGGLPRGLITELFGQEGAGKTTTGVIMLSAIVRDTGKPGVIVDFEHALNIQYVEKITGMKMNEDFFVCQPETLEDGAEILKELTSKNDISSILLDSVAAMVPKSELDGNFSDRQVAERARLFGKLINIMKTQISQNGLIGLFINQTRFKIGIVFGNPETTGGGEALKFYSWLRFRVSKKKCKISGYESSHECTLSVVKNKVNGLETKLSYILTPGVGLESEIELIDLAVDSGVLAQKGSHYYLKDKKIAASKNQMIQVLKKETNREMLLKALKK